MTIEAMADKIAPTLITGAIVGLFVMYSEVQRLKEISIDYKTRADKAHEKYDTYTRLNREKIIVMKLELQHIEDKLIKIDKNYVNIPLNKLRVVDNDQ